MYIHLYSHRLVLYSFRKYSFMQTCLMFNRPVLRIFRQTYKCFQSWNKATITLRSIRARHTIYLNTRLLATNYSRQKLHRTEYQAVYIPK